MSTTTVATSLVSITEAAKRTGVSRRTVERWIRSGRLTSVASEADHRQRLVDPAAVDTLAAASSRPGPKPVSPEHEGGFPPQSAPTPIKLATADGDTRIMVINEQDVVDQALQLAYSHAHRVLMQTCPWMFQPQSLDQLRAGPLGQDLVRLMRVARGEETASKSMVLAAIQSVLQLLFWPAAADDYTVPRSFWDTDLGRRIAQAKFRVFKPDELMSIGEAGRQLGVTRPVVYRWMDDRTLSYVRDDTSGRTFVVASEVQHLKRVALQLSDGRQPGRNVDGRLEVDANGPTTG